MSSSQKNFRCNRCYKTFALKSYLNKHYESSCFKQDSPEGGSKFLNDKSDTSNCTLDELTSDVSSSTVVVLPPSPVSSVEVDSTCASESNGQSSQKVSNETVESKVTTDESNKSKSIHTNESTSTSNKVTHTHSSRSSNTGVTGSSNITQITTRTGRKAGRFDVSFMVNSAGNGDTNYNGGEFDDEDENDAETNKQQQVRSSKKSTSNRSNQSMNNGHTQHHRNNNNSGKSDTNYPNGNNNHNNNNKSNNNHKNNSKHNNNNVTCNSLPSPSSSPSSLEGEESANTSLMMTSDCESSVVITLPLRKRAVPVEFTSSNDHSSGASGEKVGKIAKYRLTLASTSSLASPPASPNAATAKISAAQ